MLIAEVWKPPHIPQPYSIPQTREEEVTLVVPVPPLHLLHLVPLLSLALPHHCPCALFKYCLMSAQHHCLAPTDQSAPRQMKK